MRESAEPIVIVGAGPVGLTAALSLAWKGIPVQVLEARDAPADDPRATTFHPPTLDMLEEFGVTPHLVEMGTINRRWQFRDRATGEQAEFDLAMLCDETAHPYRLQCQQVNMSRVILAKLAEMDHAKIQFGAQVTGFVEHDDGVEVLATTGSGTDGIRVRGSYLIAADGASSVVRKQLEIGFAGLTYPELFILVSTPFDFRQHIPDLSDVNYVSDPGEWYSMLAISGLWRVVFPSHPDESDEEALADESIQRRLNSVVHRSVPYEVVQKTLFRVHQRVADSYRAGRVILAGDSAHLNNPLGGMGMNGGVHDALNLTEKIDRVLHGESEDLFDLYERQRRPVAIQDVQAQADRNRRLLNEKDPEVRKSNFRDLQETAGDPALAKAFLLRSSMIEGLRRAETIA
jgi:3-(3-hydroxy-phenyl)propionate hydroxylase